MYCHLRCERVFTKDKNRVMEQSDADILVNFAKSILDGTRSLDDDISKLVDENFWDLV